VTGDIKYFSYLLAGSSLVNFVVFSTTKTYYPGKTFKSCLFTFYEYENYKFSCF
jgi:hypothetical protein